MKIWDEYITILIAQNIRKSKIVVGSDEQFRKNSAPSELILTQCEPVTKWCPDWYWVQTYIDLSQKVYVRNSQSTITYLIQIWVHLLHKNKKTEVWWPRRALIFLKILICLKIEKNMEKFTNWRHHKFWVQTNEHFWQKSNLEYINLPISVHL